MQIANHSEADVASNFLDFIGGGGAVYASAQIFVNVYFWEFRVCSGKSALNEAVAGRIVGTKNARKAMEKTENKGRFPLFHSKSRCCCDGL